MHKVIFYSIMALLVILTAVLSVTIYKSLGLAASLIFALGMVVVLILS